MAHAQEFLLSDSRAPMAQPATTLDFWPVDSLASWRDAPMETLRCWLAQQRIAGIHYFRETSAETYAAMFSAWLQHLAPRQLSVLEAVASDAQSFFDLKELEPISRRRYLQLLDRVYQHLLRCGLEGESPMQAELSKERELERGLPPSLPDDQLGRLIDCLERLEGWKGARDRGLAALLLGAGLRANEVSRQTLSEISSEFLVLVRPQGVHRPHSTLIVPDGPWRRWYAAWVQLRQDKRIPGELALPSTLKGKAFEASGLFRRTKAWLEAAQIEAEQSGPNLLRSTFARKALQSGRYTLLEVQEFLGHADSRATSRYGS